MLVVEDQIDLADSVARVLRRSGMAVDGTSALERAAVVAYDLVVLDRDQPGTHGDEVYRTLARRGKGDQGPDADRLGRGGRAGGRPRARRRRLLSKPFAYAELVARIRAVARRPPAALPPVLVQGDLRLDPAQRTATRAGARLALSPKELAVLEHLLAAGGRVVSAEELLERVWDEVTDPFSTTVKATVNRLRTKLGQPPLIETVNRAGYRI